MNALVLEENATLAYKQIPDPPRTTDDSYLVRVAAAGVCGSDIHRAFAHGAYSYPLVMGHEFSGTIAKAFAGAKLTEGQRVVVYPLMPCNSCAACATGQHAHCVDYDYLGSRSDGGFAEYVAAPQKNVLPIPDHIDNLHAAMTEPCAVALHGVRRIRVKAGETAVVYGGGPIGNLAAQWLAIRGCRRILVVDIDGSKLAVARRMGFTPIDAGDRDPVAAVAELTSGRKANIVVEACGLSLTYGQAIQSTADFGQVLLLGNLSDNLAVDKRVFAHVLRRELTLKGSWNSTTTPSGLDDWSTVLQYLDRELQVSDLISHTPLLHEGTRVLPQMAADPPAAGDRSFNKVVFIVAGDSE